MNGRRVIALLSGFVFALGLGLSGMTNPARVIAFLDVGAGWDPSLLFVMAGAVGVHALFLRLNRRARPYLAPAFDAPARTAIDRELLVGAALFGLGWGASGFCPGPAVVAAVTLAPSVLIFGVGMLLGMWLVGLRGTLAPRVGERSSEA